MLEMQHTKETDLLKVLVHMTLDWVVRFLDQFRGFLGETFFLYDTDYKI